MKAAEKADGERRQDEEAKVKAAKNAAEKAKLEAEAEAARKKRAALMNELHAEAAAKVDKLHRVKNKLLASQRANALGKGGLSGQTPAELEGVDAEALVEEVGADTSARL